MKLLPYIPKQYLLFISLLLFGAAAQSQVSVNIGTIPKNKSIKIVYKVTINTGLSSGTTEVSSQGTVKGSNFSDKLTDDPATDAADDPTKTLVCVETNFYPDSDGDGFGDESAQPTAACSAPDGYVADHTDCDDTKNLYADGDGDGFGAGSPVACGVDNNTDCDDSDPDIHAGITYYADTDEDGFGDADNTTSECSSTPPTGYVSNSTDCDDTKKLYADGDDDGFGAGLPVACGVDNNTDCDDENASVHTSITYYKDNDGDGFGDAANTTSECSSTPPIGYVSNSTDCDDTKKLYADGDDDGFGAGSPVACGVANNTDCNDGDPDVNAGTTYYADTDGDGFGDADNTTSECSSTPPTGYVSNSTDCDDTKKLYADGDDDGFGAGSPVACGVADNTDCNDADGSVHTPITYYKDNDADGFGDAANTTNACSSTPPATFVSNNTDCDDTKKLYADGDGDGFGAGAPVACGVADNTDCNDNNASLHTSVTYYKDTDGDGFGNAGNTTSTCSSTPPSGYVTNSTDCDDTKKLYADADQDGFGAGSPVACGVATNTDCDDNNAALKPTTIWYLDGDNDNYYTGSGVTSCTSPGTGYKYTGLLGGNDCNDSDPAIHENCGPCKNATSLTTTNITATSAKLNWVASANPVQWQVQYKTTSPGAKWIDVPVAVTARSVTITGLKPNQSYNWHIRAKCGTKWTSYTNAVSFKTPAQSAPIVQSKQLEEPSDLMLNTSSLTLHPNPSNGRFIINLRLSNNTNMKAKIELINMLGQTVYFENGNIAYGKLQQTVAISPSLTHGMYIVKITANNKIYQKKLIYAK